MLEVQDVTKRFGPVTALAGVDMQVVPGEVVAVAGENGSGKSTLARVISGVLQPDRGGIRVDGTPISFPGPQDALKHGVALVAQELTAVPAMSVAENVLLGRLSPTLGRVRHRQLETDARPLLEEVGLRSPPSRRFSSLRSGERELVEVAKALATNPRILILDEATSRLGEAQVESLFAILRRRRERRTSAILITHRLGEIIEVADRAVVLRDGRKVGELPRGELDERRLSEMMVGRELGTFFHKRQIDPGPGLLEVDELVAPGSEHGVSLTVRSGEVVGLAGLVGAGRTELLETIAGVRTAVAGEVRVSGRRLRSGSVTAALGAGIALLPEDRRGQGLVMERSIAENVALGSFRTLARVERGRERSLGQAAIGRLGIQAAGAHAAVRTLSGGNQQKVVIGRCLALAPKVLLLDEPTRGIDVGAKEEIFRIVGEILERGLGILLASSELLEILGICDRVVVMRERRAVGELSRDEATEQRIAYLSAGGGMGDPG